DEAFGRTNVAAERVFDEKGRRPLSDRFEGCRHCSRAACALVCQGVFERPSSVARLDGRDEAGVVLFADPERGVRTGTDRCEPVGLTLAAHVGRADDHGVPLSHVISDAPTYLERLLGSSHAEHQKLRARKAAPDERQMKLYRIVDSTRMDRLVVEGELV